MSIQTRSSPRLSSCFLHVGSEVVISLSRMFSKNFSIFAQHFLPQSKKKTMTIYFASIHALYLFSSFSCYSDLKRVKSGRNMTMTHPIVLALFSLEHTFLLFLLDSVARTLPMIAKLLANYQLLRQYCHIYCRL